MMENAARRQDPDRADLEADVSLEEAEARPGTGSGIERVRLGKDVQQEAAGSDAEQEDYLGATGAQAFSALGR